MTDLPMPHADQKKLGLAIDLDLCVGCHACANRLQGMEHRRPHGGIGMLTQAP